MAAIDYPAGFQRCFINMYQCKGNHESYENHRGIFTYLHRRQDTRQDPTQPSYTAPRPGTPSKEPLWVPKERWTIYMLLIAKQPLEKCQEQNADLFSKYVDLTKAFNIQSRGPVQDHVHVQLPTAIHRLGETIP